MMEQADSVFATAVGLEVANARKIYPRILTRRKRLSLIWVEFEDLKMETLQSEADPKRLLQQCIQIASLAQRLAEDLDLFSASQTKDDCRLAEVAEAFARRLFTDGTGVLADRLVLTRPDGSTHGGWGFRPTRDQILDILRRGAPIRR